MTGSINLMTMMQGFKLFYQIEGTISKTIEWYTSFLGDVRR